VTKKVSDEDFISTFLRLKSPSAVAKALGVTERNVHDRRIRVERIHGIALKSKTAKNHPKSRFEAVIDNNKRFATIDLDDGIILVGSDAHYWKEEPSAAHKAFVAIAKKLQPKMIVMNGDVFDGARISRHDPLFNHKPPSVRDEIEACVERLGEIEKACHNAKLFWTLGNHDIRLARYVINNAPELEGLPNLSLFDYFPGWNVTWALEINEDIIIKHRLFNGVHAGYNNTLKSGRTTVTGHLHRLLVTPWGDYNGRRWGVDTGSLADPDGEQFAYMEAGPHQHGSGFAVLTVKDGKLLPPELCQVLEGVAYFRGEEV
jgi:predicted phosphodiesterase